ncbi:MAG: hypothetical protein EA377_02535 [Phycisphaerales bacterium]|nr:MAG: hypothetical protein EA377_02535 [Phycisphaerales bacterium]
MKLPECEPVLQKHRRCTTVVGLVAILLGAQFMLAGCYQRVVRGDPDRHGEIHEPNVEADERVPVVDDLEEMMFDSPE